MFARSAGVVVQIRYANKAGELAVYQVAAYQERNGRIRAIIRRKGHAPLSKTFERKTDAVKWARQIESEIDLGTLKKSKDSVASLLIRYRDEVAEHKAGWKWEQTRINKLLKEPWAAMPVSDCRVAIAHWVETRRKQVADETVNRELNVLSGIFTHAMKRWMVPMRENPISLIARPPKGKPRNKRVTPVTIAKFWAMPQQSLYTIRWYVPVMVEFAVETGLRLGELVALTWEHVHEDECWLHVEKSKNGDSRNVPMSPRALELLQLVPRTGPGPFPVHAGSFDTVYRKVCKELGIVDLHFHDTRHEAVSRLAKIYPIMQLSAVIGHRDLKSLQVYYNPTVHELVQHLHGAGQPMPRRL